MDVNNAMNMNDDSSLSKRQKSHGEGEKHVSTGQRGIERLPDEILSHALSYLETKAAIRTSVVSKQWRYVWTTVPCIKLHYYSCFIKHKRNFFDSVVRMLRLNTVPCLRNFYFDSFRSLPVPWFSKLISSVVVNRVIEELELGTGEQLVKCPRCVFTCEKLVILNLHYGILPKVPSEVYLPSLKILHICMYRELFYKDSMKRVLDGCPLLEELNIKGVNDYRVSLGNTLFVGSSSLKRLRIQSNLDWTDHRRIVLDVPNVEQLDFTHYEENKEYYEIKNISSLVKLTIRHHARRLDELLWKFAHIKYLTIFRRFHCSDDFPKFHNLTHLVVHDIDHNWPVLISLLEFLPKLVTLVSCSSCIDRELPSSTEQHMQIKAPNCLMLYLEEIELTKFKGFADEMQMARYFLKNSMELKKLSIQSESGAQIQLEILKKLLTFPRGSPDCQIITPNLSDIKL